MTINFSFLLASWLLHVGKACMSNTEYFGSLDSSLEITGSTLVSSATSCTCCALCHHNAACKSLSFGMDSKECVLYNKVGSHSGFSRESESDQNTQFFFMPNSSLTNEFCRSDSDCVTSGDFCRGRICTSDTTVTCLKLFKQNNALPDHRYWGFIDGHELRLHCRMEGDFQGATLLLASNSILTDGVPWSLVNVLDKTFEKDEYPNENTDYSILRLADTIRDLNGVQDYTVFIIAFNPAIIRQTYTAPKTMSLISHDIVNFSDGAFTAEPLQNVDVTWLAFPHLKNNAGSDTLYSIINSNTQYLDRRSLVRTNGAVMWPASSPLVTVVMYIRQ